MSESSTAKVPTARKYRPIAVRAQVFAEFLGTLERWDALMHEADGADLRTMLSSPLLGLIRMNLGEAFEIGIVHTERHLGQIERTARAVR